MQKFRGAVVLATCLMAQAPVAAQPKTSASAPATPEAAAILRSKAGAILDQSELLAAIWPGYWPREQAFILYDPAHGAVLVGADGKPREVTYRPGELPGALFSFKFDYPAGSPNMMTVRHDGDWRDTLVTLFHEQFHDFQKDAFATERHGYGGEYVDLSKLGDRVRFTAAAELERRVLADAVLADNAGRRTALARQYIALRRTREADMDEAIIGKERHMERIEGTAEYAGLAASALVLGDSEPGIAENVAEGLRRSLFANEQGSYSGNWFRTRPYDVGAGIAILLDRAGADWQKRVAQGDALDAILEGTLGAMGEQERAQIVQQARSDFDAEAIAQEMRLALAAAPKTVESKDEFLALGDRNLAITLRVPRALMREGTQSSSTRQMIPVASNATAFLDVNEFRVEKPGFELVLKGFSVMFEFLAEGPDEPLTYIYTVALDEDKVLPELDALPPGTHRLESLSLAIEGLELTIESPLSVTVRDGKIAIEASIAD